MSQRRHHRGTPKGGQFAAGGKAEAGGTDMLKAIEESRSAVSPAMREQQNVTRGLPDAILDEPTPAQKKLVGRMVGYAARHTNDPDRAANELAEIRRRQSTPDNLASALLHEGFVSNPDTAKRAAETLLE